MRKNIVAGNWKMNTTLQEGVALAKEIDAALAGVSTKCDVIIATPFTHLVSVVNAIDTKRIGVGAENCADRTEGAYTGGFCQDGGIDGCSICYSRSLRTSCILSRNSRNLKRKSSFGFG